VKPPYMLLLTVGQFKQILWRNCALWQFPDNSAVCRCPVWEVLKRRKWSEPTQHCRQSSSLLLLFHQPCGTWVSLLSLFTVNGRITTNLLCGLCFDSTWVDSEAQEYQRS